MNKNDLNKYNWLAKYPFELMISTRIPNSVRFEESHKLLVLEVLTPLSTFFNQRVAAISVAHPRTPNKAQHIHSLLIPSVPDAMTSKAEECQEFILSLPKGILLTHKGACEVKAIFNLSGACNYVANHLQHDGAQLKLYKERLLRQRRSSIND